MTFLNFRKDGIDWIVDEAYARLIPDELVSVLLAAEPSDPRIIRENRVRRSMFISSPGVQEAIFAKLYKQPAGGDTVKYFLLSSKALSEWKNMLGLYARGLPVPRPLALGEKRRFHCLQHSFLFTRALKDAEPLNALTDGMLRAINKRALVEKAAMLVAAVHNHGFFFRDFHAGNMLLVPEEEGGYRLCLVDFHKAWHTRWVPRFMRIRDLAQLRNSISLARSEQWRFLKLYMQHAHLPSSRQAALARRIDAMARKMWIVHLKSRTKRCLKESSEFAIHRIKQHTIYRMRKFPPQLIESLLENFRHQPSSLQPVILKKTDKEAVTVVTLRHEGVPCRVVIKESSFPSLGSRVRYSLFNTRARKSWIAGRALRVRGIPTADPIALIEYRSAGMMKKTVLLMRYLEQAHELNDYVLGRYDQVLTQGDLKRKESFIAALAAQVRSMHEKGVYHADLKSNNILVSEDGAGWIFYIIDLDRIRFKQHLSFTQRVNNLAQINASIADCISPADRLLFFKQYAQGSPLIRQGKKYFQAIIEIGRKKNTKPYGLTFPQAEKPSL